VFRNGKIQLPGSKNYMIEDIIEKMQSLTEFINLYTIDKKCKLIAVIPAMKNYKFSVKLHYGNILDSTVLQGLILQDQTNKIHNTIDLPEILDVKQNTHRLSVKFRSHPVRTDKGTKVTFFIKSGKINILGSIRTAHTIAICKYINGLFVSNSQRLIIRKGGLYPDWEENVVHN
jgi:TATA-box binding protein (TBP) (component of TFIID and TFIIIB)